VNSLAKLVQYWAPEGWQLSTRLVLVEEAIEISASSGEDTRVFFQPSTPRLIKTP
jgi:hypothetical protein